MEKRNGKAEWKKEEKSGREEGKKEAMEQTVKNMLKKKMDIELIQEITGLSKEEIIKIKNEIE